MKKLKGLTYSVIIGIFILFCESCYAADEIIIPASYSSKLPFLFLDYSSFSCVISVNTAYAGGINTPPR
jgi:hypothetical protein